MPRALLAAIVILGLAVPARATEVPAVQLMLPSCRELPFDAPRLEALLRVELSALGVESLEVPSNPSPAFSSGRSQALAFVVIGIEQCGATASAVRIQVIDRATRKTVEREMRLDDIQGSLRARAIALAAVELLEASWVEALLVPSRSEPARLPGPVHDEMAVRLSLAPPVDRRAGSRPRVELAALTRLFPNRGTAVLGGAATLEGQVAPSLELTGGFEAGGGDALVAQGSVTVYWVTAETGLSVTAGDEVSMSIGPRLLAGYAWARAEAASDQVASSMHEGFVLAAVLRGALRLPIGERWFGSVAVDGGATFRGVTFLADDTRAAGLAGVTTALRIGIGARLGAVARANGS